MIAIHNYTLLEYASDGSGLQHNYVILFCENNYIVRAPIQCIHNYTLFEHASGCVYYLSQEYKQGRRRCLLGGGGQNILLKYCCASVKILRHQS